MESKFNMDALFSKPHKEEYKDKDIFKKAALLYEFDIDSDFSEFNEEERKLLEKNSFLKPDKKRRLKKEDRVEILSEKIGKENLSSTIDQYKVQNDFSDLVKRADKKETIDLSKLPDNQLYYATVLSEIYTDEVNGLEAQLIYQRRQFFNQFEKVTRNFVGRTDEIRKINNYIDWLPKSGFLQKITSSFKNVIGWHDKPPMLIKGIGGIGKSTLIAKVISDQNTKIKGKTLPFIYIDFDLPGFSISEPMTVLLEALRQIEIQNPSYEKLINQIKNQIAEMITDLDGKKIKTKFTASQRGVVFNSIQDIVDNYNVEITKFKDTPILVVFDSFEEMQYRATSEQLFSFFTFIQEVSELIPRIRPIFVGRAEIDGSFGGFTFETLTLTEFDKDSASAYLERMKVNDSTTREFIYDNFGGIPLMLLLASNVYKKEQVDFQDKEKIIGKKWEYLVTRILGHIHNEKVKKIAIPGMLVRNISPEVILHILAGPTKICPIDIKESKLIFEELKKEAALITKSRDTDSFSFRQDLRMTCRNMILEKFSSEAAEIQENAKQYYQKYTEIEEKSKRDQYQAEYYYHLLKEGQIPEDLTQEVYVRLRSFLEQSIIELPVSSQIFIQSLNKSTVGEATLEKINTEEWQNYYLGRIKDGLRGELAFLETQYKEMRSRKERINDGFTEFGYYEAVMCQRLDKIRESNQVIQRALDFQKVLKPENNTLTFSFLLLRIQNLEYEEKFKEALSELNGMQLRKQAVTQDNEMVLEFLSHRLHSRMDEYYESDYLKQQPKGKYSQEGDAIDGRWNFIFNESVWQNPRYLSKQEFRDKYKETHQKTRDKYEFQEVAYKALGTFMNNITLAGKHRILMHDYIYFSELLEQKTMSRSY